MATVMVSRDRLLGLAAVVAASLACPAGASALTFPAYVPAEGSPYVLDAGTDASLATDDVDRDGDLDILAPSTGTDLTILRNDGHRRFTPIRIPFPIGGQSGPYDFADVNRDGRLDLVQGTYDGGEQYNVAAGDAPRAILSRPGGGYVSIRLPRLTGMYSYGTVFVDADADGDRDVVADTHEARLRVWPNDGDGGFGASALLPGSADLRAGAYVARGDVDGDGDEDVVSSAETGQLRIYRSGSAGLTGEAPFTLSDTANYDQLGRHLITDADLDGRADLLAVHDRSMLTASFGDGGTACPLGGDVLGPVPTLVTEHLDLDADGRPEYAFFNGVREGKPLQIAAPRGRTFEPLRDLPDSDGATSVIDPDLDADGRPDLVLAFVIDKRIAVRFAPGPPIAPGAGPPSRPECSDGIDQDRDGLVDGADPQCRAGRGVEGPADDPRLACSGRQLVLIDVVRTSGRRVALRGLADRGLAGRRVTLVADGRRIATARIAASGTFAATARAVRGGATRFQARLGSRRSLNLKLSRRTVAAQARRVGAQVQMTGRVSGERRGARVELLAARGCRAYTPIATAKLRADGRFTVRGTPPIDVDIAVFRARVTLRSGRTFSLPRTVRR